MTPLMRDRCCRHVAPGRVFSDCAPAQCWHGVPSQRPPNSTPSPAAGDTEQGGATTRKLAWLLLQLNQAQFGSGCVNVCCNQNDVKVYILYNAVCSPQDCSKHFTLHRLVRLKTISASLGSIQPCFSYVHKDYYYTNIQHCL